ncbi:MAG TPA: DPP IV N-terminal domain-containing protein [Bacteroidota bacterium]|nr:DPP IV N-terminal domain-containing protein [Bacteroidota bacterium]
MRLRFLTVGFLIAVGLSNVVAQEADFGENKVQYKKFNWSYIQTSHFDIYFSQGGEYLADFTAAAAESAYTMITKSFRYQTNNRIPIMVYNSHNDFQQTNVLSEYLEEGTGGVTELFKNRMVIPFEGNYRMFRHVIHHEMVHAIFNDMFYGGSIQSIISNNIRLQLPMWFNEGMAEYQSLGWDNNSDMFMRDATIHTYLPPIDYLSGYFAYRGGQSVWNYIADKYGDQKIAEILNRIKGTRSIEQGFKSALGLSISELSDRWQKEQKVMYWPDIAKREDPADFATRITNHAKESNFYNTSPSISPQGDKIAFISDRDDYFDVFIISTIDNKVTKLVDGYSTKNFEELHLLTPGITWSPDGKKIALAVKSGDADAIFIVDVETGKQEKLEFKLDGIFSVDWSPKGDKLAFVGDNTKQSDIYVYDLATKDLTNLTDDVFSDSDPHWSPDGKTVYFVSDRRDYVRRDEISRNFKMWKFDYSQLDIYSMNIETSEMKRITDYPKSDETSPVISPDGTKMLYVSDRNGIGNIYERDLATGADRPITNSISGVFQLSLSADGNKLSFAAFENGGFDIFLMKAPFEKKLDVATLEPTEYLKREQQLVQKTQTPAGAETGKDSTLLADSESGKDTTGVYGDKVRIDFHNYVFSDEQTKEKPAPPAATSSESQLDTSLYLDANGDYKVNKYKLNFSPDIIYGNAAYSTFYGVQGTTMMAFSDMLGDHQIYFLTNLLLDLKNSDYVLAYYYLPLKIDYGIQGYHSARFLYLYDYNGDLALYRFTTWGVATSASDPLDKFNRFDFGLSWLNLARENLDYPDEPAQRRTLLMPTLDFVHDNSLWGYTAPNNGTRYNISAMISPSISSGSEGLDFQTFTLDYRTYEKFWKDYSFVIRWAGGLSMGRNPQRFFIGGTDGWINREFANNDIPIQNVEDYAFLSPALPLRGFDYNEKNGTKYGLMNYELRFPLIRYLVTGGVPLALENITGATFIDVGSSWTDNKAFRFFEKDPDGNTVAEDLLMGTGFGARLILFGLPLKFDVAWAFDGQSFSIPKYYISLGQDF